MKSCGVKRATVAAATCGLLLTSLAACGDQREEVSRGAEPKAGGTAATIRPSPSQPSQPPRVPGVGARLWQRVPADTRQVVAVYGESEDSPDSTLVLYEKRGSQWELTAGWPAHNGKQGWTTDHRMGDERSPVGVFTLSDAGGVLPDPGTRFPYLQDEQAFTSPYYWDESHWHDFDYVIAIDYNRRRGVPPDDPTRPQGEAKGGGIWLHLDHGNGTLGCVSVPKEAMERLLRTLDPKQNPVVVMGDKANLMA
ncbi:L,D-transpeptidase family protein [Streptomyces sp. NPDC046831]|uniref:L,D-transpeptidase family protein n=1 Tax=Streptomyces sp. NPDC046831 TaxID=3154805 RepID=UPI00340E920E